MSFELIYTSAPRGLKPGSSGFCTVAMTPGMPAYLVDVLESLSSYRHLFPPHSSSSGLNPVNYAHYVVRLGGERFHVLSRVADAGQDYSGRTNKIAHHVVLGPDELVPGGPAWALTTPGFFATSWDGHLRFLESGRLPRTDPCPLSVCSTWERVTGDAGWAGVVAGYALGAPRRLNFIFVPGMPVLEMLVEALALLPPEKRWGVTFATYFTTAPAGVQCDWRFIPAGTAEAKKALRQGAVETFDLTSLPPRAPDGPLVEVARSGCPAPGPRLAKGDALDRERSERPPIVAPAAPAQPAPAVTAVPVEEPGGDFFVVPHSAAPRPAFRRSETLWLPIALFVGLAIFLTLLVLLVVFVASRPSMREPAVALLRRMMGHAASQPEGATSPPKRADRTPEKPAAGPQASSGADDARSTEHDEAAETNSAVNGERETQTQEPDDRGSRSEAARSAPQKTNKPAETKDAERRESRPKRTVATPIRLYRQLHAERPVLLVERRDLPESLRIKLEVPEFLDGTTLELKPDGNGAWIVRALRQERDEGERASGNTGKFVLTDRGLEFQPETGAATEVLKYLQYSLLHIEPNIFVQLSQPISRPPVSSDALFQAERARNVRIEVPPVAKVNVTLHVRDVDLKDAFSVWACSGSRLAGGADIDEWLRNQKDAARAAPETRIILELHVDPARQSRVSPQYAAVVIGIGDTWPPPLNMPVGGLGLRVEREIPSPEGEPVSGFINLFWAPVGVFAPRENVPVDLLGKYAIRDLWGHMRVGSYDPGHTRYDKRKAEERIEGLKRYAGHILGGRILELQGKRGRAPDVEEERQRVLDALRQDVKYLEEYIANFEKLLDSPTCQITVGVALPISEGREVVVVGEAETVESD